MDVSAASYLRNCVVDQIPSYVFFSGSSLRWGRPNPPAKPLHLQALVRKRSNVESLRESLGGGGEREKGVEDLLDGGENRLPLQDGDAGVKEGASASDLTSGKVIVVTPEAEKDGVNVEAGDEVKRPGPSNGGGQTTTLPRLPPPSSPRCRLSLALSEPGGTQHQRSKLSPSQLDSLRIRPVMQVMSPISRPGELSLMPRVRPLEGGSGIMMGQASLSLTRASPRQRQFRTTSPLTMRQGAEQQIQAGLGLQGNHSPTCRPASLSIGPECWPPQAGGFMAISQGHQSPSVLPRSSADPRLCPPSQRRARPASVASPTPSQVVGSPQLWTAENSSPQAWQVATGRPDLTSTSCLPFCPSWPG